MRKGNRSDIEWQNMCSFSFEINDERMKREKKKDGKGEHMKERERKAAAMGGRAYRAARVPLNSRIKPL